MDGNKYKYEQDSSYIKKASLYLKDKQQAYTHESEMKDKDLGKLGRFFWWWFICVKKI